MKKLLLITILIISFSINTIVIAVPNYNAGNITYTLNWFNDHTTCELVISGNGKMADECPIINTYEYDVPWRDFKESIVSIVIDEGITEVGGFGNCNYLTKVSLPNSLKSIDKYAFVNCSSLEKIEIPDNVESIKEGCFNRVII